MLQLIIMAATIQPPLPAKPPAAARKLVALPMMPLSLRPVMGAALPLAHFALALPAVPLAFALSAWKAAPVASYFYLPETLAATHLITLGFLTPVALGALQTLLPAGPFPRWRRVSAWSGLALLAAGLALFIALLLQKDLTAVWPATLLIYTGLILEISGLLPSLATLDHFDYSTLGITLAQVNLLTTGAAGVLYAIDKHWSFLTVNFFGRIFAHAHLAAVGFLLTLFVAVAHQLIPMFLWSDNPKRRWGWYSVIGVGGGAQLLFWSLMLGWPAWPGAILIAAGWILFMVDGHRFVKTRRRPFPLVLRQTMLGELVLVAAGILGLYLAIAPFHQTINEFKLRYLYGVLLIAGGLTAIVLGVFGRLVPEILWYAALRPGPGETVRVKPEELLNGKIYLAGGIICLLGTLGVAFAAFRADASIMRIAALVALAGAALQSVLMARAFLWLLPGVKKRRLAALPKSPS